MNNLDYHIPVMLNEVLEYLNPKDDFVKEDWPKLWEMEWFKPTIRIRDLVKAGALISAEIDRLWRMNMSDDEYFDENSQEFMLKLYD